MQDWFYWAFGTTMVVMLLSWFLFGRVTMARIERELKKEGLPRPCSWDGPGARIVWYAWAIAVPISKFNPSEDPLIDVPLIRSRATATDRALALVMLVSTITLVVLAFV